MSVLLILFFIMRHKTCQGCIHLQATAHCLMGIYAEHAAGITFLQFGQEAMVSAWA